MTDVDECVTPANNCKFNCKNLIGSFMCDCPEGYSQVGTSDDCRDVNECLTQPNICLNGRCVNLQGSFRCDCFEGFKPSYDYKQCIGKTIIFLVFINYFISCMAKQTYLFDSSTLNNYI